MSNPTRDTGKKEKYNPEVGENAVEELGDMRGHLVATPQNFIPPLVGGKLGHLNRL